MGKGSILLGFCLASLGSNVALAHRIHETLYYPEQPTRELIARWSALEGTRDYTIEMHNPYASELENLNRLRNFDRLQILVTEYPPEEPETLAQWRTLAEKGAELVSLYVGIPNATEIDRLNRIGFRKILFVLNYYPNAEEGAVLDQLRSEAAITFTVRRYPNDWIQDGPGLDRMRDDVPLLFVTDYWPGQFHRVFFNWLRHPLKFRIRDAVPLPEHYEALNRTRMLEDITVEHSSSVPTAIWGRFPERAKLNWNTLTYIPTESDLEQFQSLPHPGKNITIDRDLELTSAERLRLELSPLSIRWIHRAPDF